MSELLTVELVIFVRRLKSNLPDSGELCDGGCGLAASPLWHEVVQTDSELTTPTFYELFFGFRPPNFRW